MKRKLISFLAISAMVVASLTACGGSDKNADANTNTESTKDAGADTAATDAGADTAATDTKDTTGAPTGTINVTSREDGSGTRGAFIELFGVQQEVNGQKVDMTTEEANITNSTSVMMSTVAGDPNAIGYISLGSLDQSVKALKIDGAEATADNIKAGTYKISRPFNIAVKKDLSDAAADFMNFILSTEGQKVIADNNYIPLDNTTAYEGKDVSGKVVVAGSSSVSPVMEKLKEAYGEVNSKVEIEIQTSDSTTGMQNAIDGVCDIGMASRELKDSELSAGLTPTVIAIDGIAVIVNNENSLSDLTSDQVKSIYTGETLTWDEVAK